MKKRRFITIIMAALLLLVLVTGCSSNNASSTERTQSVKVEDQNSDTAISTESDWDTADSNSNSSSGRLSESDVRSIIEKHTPDLKGVDMWMELDSDDGIRVYEVDARTSSHKYDFEVNASNGDILHYGIEMLNPKVSNSGNVISEQKVRSIVEKYTPELKGENLRIERDTDDGITVYEVEGRTSTHEYDFEIHAYTGDVLQYDEEVR